MIIWWFKKIWCILKQKYIVQIIMTILTYRMNYKYCIAFSFIYFLQCNPSSSNYMYCSLHSTSLELNFLSAVYMLHLMVFHSPLLIVYYTLCLFLKAYSRLLLYYGVFCAFRESFLLWLRFLVLLWDLPVLALWRQNQEPFGSSNCQSRAY